METTEIDSDEEFNTNILLTLLPQTENHDTPTNSSHSSNLTQTHHLKSINQTLVTRQLRSQGLSFQLWPAASTLLSLLDSDPQIITNRITKPNSKLKLLELGSGTGLAGIAAAAILGADVTLTDLPHVLDNLRYNADINADVVKARGGSVSVKKLMWGKDEDLVGLGDFDLVIGTDVVYYEELFDDLVASLRGLVKEEASFVMAHLRRWKKKDSLFFRKARKFFDVEVLFKDEALPGTRLGVVVYCFVVKKNNAKMNHSY